MAIFLLSFPNCLCVFMVLAVILHMFTRDATTRGVQETHDGLEVLYCKFPQAWSLEETKRCSSMLSLFLRLTSGCSNHAESREQDLLLTLKSGSIKEEVREDVKEHIVMEESASEGLEDAGVRNDKNEEAMSSTLVDSFVICLLVLSAGVSLKEWYKEKNRNAGQQVGGGGEGAPPGEGENMAATAFNRRFSLADLTVNRHIRRKESQQHQQQPIVRQSSTGAAVKLGGKPPPLLRRSSFPAQFPEVRSRQAPQRQQSQPGVPPSRRMSVDLTEDDSSPDRRRVRIIRRH